VSAVSEAAVVGVMTLSLPRERTDLAQRFQESAIKELRGVGLDIVCHGQLVMTTDAAVEAARELASRHVDCIVYLLGTWVFAPAVVSAMQAVAVPSGIWADGDPGSFSLTAGGIVHGSLDELGIAHRFFYGPPQHSGTVERIAAFARAARVVSRLRGSRMGLIGGRVMGMYTTEVDTAQIKSVFGVELEHVDSLRHYLEAQRADASAVANTRDFLGKGFGEIAVDGEPLERSIRLYHGLRAILDEDGYDFAAVKCQGAMIDSYACSCLATSLLNDEGTVVACESDVNAALTMQMLKLVSGKGPVLFGDINHLDLERGLLRIVNCGSMPSLLATTRKEVDLAPQYDYMGKAGGATVVLCCKPGPVTIARLSRIEGQYVMLIAEGEAVEQPKSRFKEAREHWPHMFVSLPGDAEAFVQNVRSNHLHACYGHYAQELMEVCELFNVAPLEICS
jgi:L-fucose isomerase